MEEIARPAVWAMCEIDQRLASAENGALQMSRMSHNVALFRGATSATFETSVQGVGGPAEGGAGKEGEERAAVHEEHEAVETL